jgi:uncharacterized protein (DUF924 family)
MITPEDILHFWFHEAGPQAWWKKSDRFDALIKRKFLDLHRAAHNGELWSWRQRDRGRLAEIIVLDQFSRNMFRDQAQAFASDALALALAQEAVLQKVGAQWPVERQMFLYMPYMHSESPVVHEQAFELFDRPGLEDNFDFELRHKAIIDRFGRYPHRNAVLGRQSTPEEIAFLKEPGSSF